MAKNFNPSKRLDTPLDAYNALGDALALIMAVQAAGLRGVIPADRKLAAKISEARAATTAAIDLWPPIQPADTEPNNG